MLLINKSTGLVVAQRVEMAISFTRRLKGLLGRSFFPPGSALMLQPCRQVHTFFMRFPIDVIFLDQRGTVLTVLVMSPGRVSPYVSKAQMVVELPAGTAAATGITEDHELKLMEQEGRE